MAIHHSPFTIQSTNDDPQVLSSTQTTHRILFVIVATIFCLVWAGSFLRDFQMLRIMPQRPLGPARLSRICSSTLCEGEDYIANVVCVAELRPPSKQQPCNWLNEYISKPDSKKIQVIEFNYQWEPSKLPVWPSLIQRSADLLDSLQKDEEGLGTSRRPLVLVGHGLGGLVVKKAATTLFERYWDTTYKDLRKNLSGIVLFGTPHTTQQHQERWSSLTFLLRSYYELSGQSLYQAELEGATVAKLSERFEEFVQNTPVISVYETKKTKMVKSLFGSKERLLVGEDLSQTSVNQEVLVESNNDHDNICTLSPGSLTLDKFSSLIDNIANMLNDSQSTSEDDSFAITASVSWSSSELGDALSRAERDGSITSGNHIAHGIAAVDLSGRVPRPKLPCHVLKINPASNFIGRDEVMDILDKELLPRKEEEQRSGLRSYALCGMGGLGKSEIAIQFITTRQKSFDATFFISAENAVKLDDAFSEIAIKLQLITSDEAKDRLTSRAAVLEWLGRPYKTPPETTEEGMDSAKDLANWLIVFDGIECATLLKDYSPLQGPGSILITSRDPFAKHYLSPHSGLDLLPLSEPAATELLESLTYKSISKQDQDEALHLAQRLGCLPIAILHAAGVIEKKDSTFEEYLKRYEKDTGICGDALLAMKQGSYAQTLTAVWALENLPLKASALLKVMALLENNPIQEALLLHGEGYEIIEAYPSADSYDEARQILSQASLIRRNKQLKTLSIHHVVQDVARQIMTRDELRDTFEIAVVLVNANWKEERYWAFSHRLSDWEVAEIAVPHVLRLAKHFRVHKPTLKSTLLVTFTSLVTRASIHLKERGHWDESLSLAKLALGVLENHKGDMNEQYADILMSLSSSYHCLGDSTQGLKYARAHFKQRILVEDSKSPVERDDAFRAMALTELSLGWLLNNNYTEAIDLAVQGRKLLEGTREFIDDAYWPHWADYHHSWALIGLGRAEEARPILEAMLKWRQRHYGPNDAESMKTAYALQILGVINEKAGKIDEAIESWEQALVLYCRTEGDSSFRTNQVRVKLGEYYGRLGKPETAEKMFDTALKYFTGDKYYKAERARTLFKKAQFLELMDNAIDASLATQEAERLFREVCLQKSGAFPKAPLQLKDFDDIVMIMSR